MRVWRWNCQVHYLSLLIMQTANEPPFVCSGLVEVVYPDSEPCRFSGRVLLDVYPTIPDRGLPVRSPDSHLRSGTPPTAGGAAGEAGRVTTPPLPATPST